MTPMLLIVLIGPLIVLPGCATQQAQKELTETTNRMRNMQAVVEQAKLQLQIQCGGMGDSFARTFAAVNHASNNYPEVFAYMQAADQTNLYMQTHNVSIETALRENGDIILPQLSRLDEAAKSLKGCMVGLSLDMPRRFIWSIAGKEFRDKLKQAMNGIVAGDPRLQPINDLWNAYVETLIKRSDNGDLTVLQLLQATSAGQVYMRGEGQRILAELHDNVTLAQLQDQTTLNAIAVGLGAVATAAIVVNTYENYRIANAANDLATTAQLQAIQNAAPIQCTVTHGRYTSNDYVTCR